MKSWEIEIKILADDFGLPRSLVKSAIKKGKRQSSTGVLQRERRKFPV